MGSLEGHDQHNWAGETGVDSWEELLVQRPLSWLLDLAKELRGLNGGLEADTGGRLLRIRAGVGFARRSDGRIPAEE